MTLTSCGVTIQALGYIARRIAERLCLHLCCEANLHTYNVMNLQPKTRSRLREPSAFAMASNHDDNRSSEGATVHSEIRWQRIRIPRPHTARLSDTLQNMNNIIADDILVFLYRFTTISNTSLIHSRLKPTLITSLTCPKLFFSFTTDSPDAYRCCFFLKVPVFVSFIQFSHCVSVFTHEVSRKDIATGRVHPSVRFHSAF